MADLFTEDTRLRFVTSEGNNDRPKTNLFCAFHPKDQKNAHEVMHDLMGVCDCTVFYYEDGGNHELQDHFTDDLDQMSLVILIVSSNFLLSDSFAKDVMYPYAAEHQIPVLPIMIESGLEEPFNNQIGNLQFLLLNSECYDSTCVPYREKLKNFLSQTVCTDVSTENFRDAFDTSIFLSYRKKDRRYAQSLMEMIHSDERCHGVAIWYDEFLIPGEDFNGNISQELADSALMILVVTPHITEKNNYIILTEYPAAVAIGKTVLPFEMCQTSRDALDEQYPQLPDLLPTDEVGTVRDAILRAIDQLGIKPVSSSAEIEYIRGLAYLKGIRVEKNSKIGVRKILAAAEGGVAPAMQSLALMYKNGEGVPVSIADAAHWQKRYIQVLQEDSSVEHKAELSQAYFDLAQIYEQELNYSLALETYLKITALFAQEELQREILFMELFTTAMIKAGSLYMLQGDYFSAKCKCFEQALNIRQQQYKLQPSQLQEVKICELYALLAECSELCQNRSDAKHYTVQLQKAIPSPADIDTVQADSYSLVSRILNCNNKLGHLLITLFDDRGNEAFICIGNSVLLAQKLLAISECYSSRLQLILALINDGDQHAGKKVPNHLHEAEAAYDRAFSEAFNVAVHYGSTLEINRLTGQIQQKQAFVKLALGDPDAAATFYDTATILFRHNYKLFASLSTRKDLYDCIREACAVKNTGIEAALLEVISLTQENVAQSELAVYKRDEAAAHAMLSAIYKKEWDMDNSFTHTKSQLDLLRQVMRSTGRLSDIKLFSAALKNALPIAKLAGEFETHRAIQAELAELVTEYKDFLT